MTPPDRATLIAWVKDKASWWHKRSVWWQSEGSAGNASSSLETATIYDAIAALLEAEAWQPISTAPKDGTDVLLRIEAAMGHFYTDIGSWFATRDGGYWTSHAVKVRTAHWRPLPAPPVTEAR